MAKVYPEAPPPAPEVVLLDDITIAARIVTRRESDEKATKENCIGSVLGGEGTVSDFYRVWHEIEEERLAMEAVPVMSFETKTAYKTALGKVKKRLDVQKFADGVMARAKVTTWAEFLEKLKPIALEI